MPKTITLKVYGRVDPKREEKRRRDFAPHRFLGREGVRKVRHPFDSMEVQVTSKRAFTDGRNFTLEKRYQPSMP